MTIGEFKKILKPTANIVVITAEGNVTVFNGQIGDVPAENDGLEVIESSVSGEATVFLV